MRLHWCVRLSWFMKSNIEAADMKLCCWSSKDCGATTLVPVQVSADKEKIYSWYYHVVLWSHNATPRWTRGTSWWECFWHQIGVQNWMLLQTVKKKLWWTKGRSTRSSLGQFVCNEISHTDDTSWISTWVWKTCTLEKKSPLRYLKQKGCTAQPKFP